MDTHRDIEAGDRRLVSRIRQQGDEGAFRELYRRYTPRLTGFATRLLAGAESEVEDVVQETWIRACESLDRFRWRASFSTWLQGIGLNVVREQLRRQSRFPLAAGEEVPAAATLPASDDDRLDLERLIRELPDAQRLVLVLHDIEGMKHREIAERLGMPEGTSKSHLSRARGTLRGKLADVEESEHACR